MNNKLSENKELIPPTINWHDFDTWVADPEKYFPCQFAGICTDFNLNVISELLIFLAK